MNVILAAATATVFATCHGNLCSDPAPHHFSVRILNNEESSILPSDSCFNTPKTQDELVNATAMLQHECDRFDDGGYPVETHLLRDANDHITGIECKRPGKCSGVTLQFCKEKP